MSQHFSCDTNCLVAILSDWHPHYQDSLQALQKLSRNDGRELVLAAHTVFECFSVLTRMPRPHRVEASDAKIAIEKAFGHARRAISNLDLYDATLEACVRSGNAGGLAYDALIAHTVYDQGASLILSWNAKHMKLVAPPGLEVLRPDQVLL